MAGFVGIFRGNGSDESGGLEVEPMVQTLLHQPHHTVERITDPALGVGIAWIRDTRCDGVVQAWNSNCDISLILAGEDFAASGNGTPSMSTEKAERQIRAYENRGLKFIEDLNGWFSGVLIDRRQEQVVLFNDRYGLSRVYYHESPNGFYFASEAKAILKVLP